MPEWSLDAVRHALATARDHGFAEMELEASGTVFQARFSSSSKRPKTTAAGTVEEERDDGPAVAEITSMLVGYYQPANLALQVGQQVQKGDLVAIITALGLANDVESLVSGEVLKVLVDPGQSVMYGQALAQVRLNS